jgi:hypothetical protein
MTPVLLYSHPLEPVTQSFLELDKDLNLVKLSLEDLLNDACIFDEVNDTEVKIEWTLSSGIKISNSSEFYIFNRVLSVPEEIFQDFHPDDKSYAASEFRAYLAFAIESFPKCSSKPGPFGLSGNLLSLPRQWEKVKSSFHLNAPEYFLGNLSLIPCEDPVVYSTPHNYYYWKSSLDKPPSCSFAFKIPLGSPIICCVIGESVEVYPYLSHQEISHALVQQIKDTGRKLAALFCYHIAEVLLFSDDSKLSFGMISTIPYASRKKPWFKSLLSSFLKQELSRSELA